MKQLRELVRSFEPRWAVYATEFTRLQTLARVAVLALISWSGLAAAATACALITIERAARSAAAPGRGISRVARLEHGNGEAILQRPVFSRTRQAMPPVLPQAPPPPAGPPPALGDSGLRLTGVFINTPISKAFLTSAQKPVGSWVQPDEVFGGWKLVAVRPNEVEVESGGERVMVPFSTVRAANDGPSPGQNFQPHAPAGGERLVGPFPAGRTAHEQAGTVQNFQPYPPVRR